MQKQLIPPSKNLGYTDLYLDFVNGRVKGNSFYLADHIEAVAGELDKITYDRSRLVAILTEQNKRFDAGPRTFENINRLIDPKAVCVLAGQQAGLFGGPMFTLIKAIAVIKSALRYETQLGRPVIPIFWIAGDDHDFEEANHTSLLNRSGDLVEIKYATAPRQEVPVARISFEDAEMLAQAKAAVKECCGETDFTPSMYALLDRSYAQGVSFVTAFGRLLSGLLGDRGLVLFCPTDNTATQRAVPFFKKIISLQDDIHIVVGNTNNALLEQGFHIQVEKKDSSSHLFYELNGRQPVLREGEQFVVGESIFSRDQLVTKIEEHPELFSPDVMTRPLLQSYLFPTLTQKGGPSEIAYLAQINPLFELFDLAPPVHQARPTATMVENRFEKLLDEWKISFDELFGDIEQLINRIMAATFPDDLEAKFKRLTQGVEGEFREFIGEALAFDESLKQVADQVYGKVDYNLKNFEQKVFAAHKRKSNELREKIYRMHHHLCPNRGFQERSVNALYFVSRYGEQFVRFLFNQLDSEETAHQLIYLSEMTDR